MRLVFEYVKKGLDQVTETYGALAYFAVLR